MKDQLQFIMESCHTVLPAREEREAFRRLNVAKKKKQGLLKKKKRTRSESSQLRYARVAYNKERGLIVRCNFGLVTSMIKKTRAKNVEYDDLLSEGMMILVRSTDKFKVSKGTKFSTYACRALLNGFSRLGMLQGKKHDHCLVDHIVATKAQEEEVAEDAEDHSELQAFFETHIGRLEGNEEIVIRQRFGINPKGEKSTLQQLSDQLGISKENIRQLQGQALATLREVMHTLE